MSVAGAGVGASDAAIIAAAHGTAADAQRAAADVELLYGSSYDEAGEGRGARASMRTSSTV